MSLGEKEITALQKIKELLQTGDARSRIFYGSKTVKGVRDIPRYAEEFSISRIIADNLEIKKIVRYRK